MHPVNGGRYWASDALRLRFSAVPFSPFPKLKCSLQSPPGDDAPRSRVWSPLLQVPVNIALWEAEEAAPYEERAETPAVGSLVLRLLLEISVTSKINRILDKLHH